MSRQLTDSGDSGQEILFLTDSFLPHAGGSRVYYFNLYKRLADKLGLRVRILTKKVEGWQEFDQAQASENLQITRRFKPLATWRYSELPKGVLPLPETLWRTLKGHHPVLHAGDLFPPGLICLALKKLLRTPYLAYCHGEEITQTDRYQNQPRIRDRIYRSANAIVAASEFARQNLLRIGISAERIHKITPGVDCSRFSPRPPKEALVRQFGLSGKTVLLTVARLWPRKGHDVLLRAIARICESFPNLHYLVVGKGPEKENLERLAQELNISSLVTFVGYVPEQGLPDYYNLSNIFAMPNREESNGDIEGFGIVFLEAGASGSPVLGGRSGGASEAIREDVTGFLVDPESVEEIAESLRALMGNSELRAKLGEAGRRRAVTEFDWDSRAESLWQVNHEISARAKAAR